MPIKSLLCLQDQDVFSTLFLVRARFTQYHEVPNLSKQSPLIAGTTDMLWQVSALNRAADSPDWYKTCTDGSNIAKKGVIEIAKSVRQVFLCLASKEERKVAIRLQSCVCVKGQVV